MCALNVSMRRLCYDASGTPVLLLLAGTEGG
jgi:hypothetical protein